MTDFPSDAERNDQTWASAGDDAFARLEKEMAAMKSATAGLSDQIADAASDLKPATQGQAKQGLTPARGDMGSLADTLEGTVRKRPLSAVALALGLGFLIGAISRR